jgi:hypothetical protein
MRMPKRSLASATAVMITAYARGDRKFGNPTQKRRVTSTGWRALCSGRLRCGTGGRSDRGRPAPLRAPPHVFNRSSSCSSPIMKWVAYHMRETMQAFCMLNQPTKRELHGALSCPACSNQLLVGAPIEHRLVFVLAALHLASGRLDGRADGGVVSSMLISGRVSASMRRATRVSAAMRERVESLSFDSFLSLRMPLAQVRAFQVDCDRRAWRPLPDPSGFAGGATACLCFACASRLARSICARVVSAPRPGDGLQARAVRAGVSGYARGTRTMSSLPSKESVQPCDSSSMRAK